MGKLRVGPASYIIRSSNGAENEKLDFYATSYSSNFGREGFIARNPKCKGTGYLANFRTGVYYTPALDDLDNPQIGQLLRDNYVSTYSKHNRLYNGSNGKDELPISLMKNNNVVDGFRVIRKPTGFTQGLPLTHANTKTVHQVRAFSIEDDTRHKPYLHRLQKKRVPQLDEGSMGLVTETSKCYKGEPSNRMNTHLKSVGHMQPSGFTHYHHEDPIQYLPKAPYGGEISNRWTEITQHQVKYVRWPTLNGAEMNSGVRARAQRDSGYCHETARPSYVCRVPSNAFTDVNQVPPPVAERTWKSDPCEFVNMTRGPRKTTLAQAWYGGKQSSQTAMRDVSHAARKESSGFSTNNRSYLETKPTRHNFLTNYDVKFNYPHKIDKYLNIGDTPKASNGFTKGTLVQVFGDRKRFDERQMESYNPLVARIIKKENPCYTDSTRNSKLRFAPEVC